MTSLRAETIMESGFLQHYIITKLLLMKDISGYIYKDLKSHIVLCSMKD